jgi:hypothetical protein
VVLLALVSEFCEPILLGNEITLHSAWHHIFSACYDAPVVDDRMWLVWHDG